MQMHTYLSIHMCVIVHHVFTCMTFHKAICICALPVITIIAL